MAQACGFYDSANIDLYPNTRFCRALCDISESSKGGFGLPLLQNADRQIYCIACERFFSPPGDGNTESDADADADADSDADASGDESLGDVTATSNNADPLTLTGDEEITGSEAFPGNSGVDSDSGRQPTNANRTKIEVLLFQKLHQLHLRLRETREVEACRR